VRALPLAVVAGLLAYGLLSSAGALGALLLVVILLLAGSLAVWARGADPAARTVLGRTAMGAMLCAPALLVVFFSFSSGGFFPDSVALGALAVAVVLVIRLGLADQPLAAIGPRALVPLVGLAGLAGWALLSQFWSPAPGRATIAFDRDLLYLLTFALFASVGAKGARSTWPVRSAAFAMVAGAAVSLISRVRGCAPQMDRGGSGVIKSDRASLLQSRDPRTRADRRDRQRPGRYPRCLTRRPEVPIERGEFVFEATHRLEVAS